MNSPHYDNPKERERTPAWQDGFWWFEDPYKGQANPSWRS